jgi:hypothetical protein
MTVIWTLPGTFDHQQTNGAELGGAAAQQSTNFFVELALRRFVAELFSRGTEDHFRSVSAARLAMDPFEKERLLPIEVMIALAINLVIAILGYYAIMMWGLFRG